MENITIRDVRTILTAPEGIGLVVVKIETSEPGLYGLGCATFTQRCLAVKSAVDDYMKPFLLGKDPQRIEDIWQSAMVSAYWRNGPVLSNAVSGVDMALWDIKGKLAGLPLYQLLGGKCREAAAVYRHADGRDRQEVLEHVMALREQGYRTIRCQIGGYGGRGHTLHTPEQPLPGAYFDPAAYAHSVVRLFEFLRTHLGPELELLHDTHERLSPIDAVRLAKDLEPFRLFFLEDVLPPEQIDWFRMLRGQCATPIAMGELFNNPREWLPLIQERLIDFIRVHISQIGGITPAKKLAILCEAFGVRTAWHGPGDVSPVGHAANVHLDVASHNFGIQEWSGLSERLQEVFPGCPQVRDGFVYPNDAPGLGIDLDEKQAARYPCDNRLPQWTLARLPDGTSVRP
ncbi:MAG: enolase C-terminal domain-like protein [Eubacteriales bacterium]|nr:enolase C-terminal domain-like protein [Eubacteriales bacterium]MDD4744609.1 enolase C-terminal domain-like protein [Eubacteriales bacterium]